MVQIHHVHTLCHVEITEHIFLFVHLRSSHKTWKQVWIYWAIIRRMLLLSSKIFFNMELFSMLLLHHHWLLLSLDRWLFDLKAKINFSLLLLRAHKSLLDFRTDKSLLRMRKNLLNNRFRKGILNQWSSLLSIRKSLLLLILILRLKSMVNKVLIW